MSIDETELRVLLVNFFFCQGCAAADVHSQSEHGVDVIAEIPRDKDPLNKGFNVLIQAKKGKLGLRKWRDEVLGQLYEMTFCPPEHQYFRNDRASRRVLAVTGKLTDEVHKSIGAYNRHTSVRLEVYELDDLITLFDDSGQLELLLDRIRKVGVAMESEKVPPPMVVGE